MTLFNKKLFYKNADKWIEKLLKIARGIPNDKLMKHKFDVKSGIFRIAE